MSATRTQNSAILPITLDDAKIHEREDLDEADNNDYITAQLSACVDIAENFTRRAFITQEWQFQSNIIYPFMKLPYPPLQTIDSVYTLDSDGTATLVDADNYMMDNVSQPGRIIFKSSFSSSYGVKYYYPVLRVNFTAGYGDLADDVPWEIKEGILQAFGHLYENRESQMMPPEAMNLLFPYKVLYL
jgi:uncharacterized phiE125 gp8 family phage protein